jgi:peptidoglycan/xylan/chitin deacetylase (PgdA/CDA1 family)
LGAEHYKLTVQQFAAHLAAIDKAIEGKPVLVSDKNWDSSFLFTMDDGGSSSPYVADQLERHGWRGHFFITTNYIGTAGFMNEGELRELANHGHMVGSHTCSHPIPLWDCTPEQVFTEWHNSRQKLENILGEPVSSASVPGGAYSPEVAASAARAGYRHLFTSEPTRNLQYVDGCQVIGRYMILQTTPAEEAAKLAVGDPWTCGRQVALWNGKKMLRKWAAGPYAAARAYMMHRRYPESAVDQPQDVRRELPN